MDWKVLTAIVCTFGFVKDFRPSEAYLVLYLTGPRKNLTEEQVNNEIFPWWTYSYLLWLIPVFLLTDYLRYKPILVLEGLAYIVTWVLLLWAQGVPAMKVMDVLYGLVTATEIAYYSYLYAHVAKEHFTKIASFTRGATLAGYCTAYVTGQLMVSYKILDYFELHIVSLVSVSIAFIIALFLPRSKYSDIFHQRTTDQKENGALSYTSTSAHNVDARGIQQTVSMETQTDTTAVSSSTYSKFIPGVRFLLNEIKDLYSNRTIVIWSCWWTLASCGNLQVINYIQNLWTAIAPNQQDQDIYNGAVEAAATFLGAVSVIFVGFVPIDWSRKGRGEVTMAVVCASNAAILIVMGTTSELWVAYVLYVIFRILYQTVITIATAQIAGAMTRQRYGFVFGCNMFLALLIETILTAVVVDENGLGVDVVTQFIVYGGYFAVIAVLFLGAAVSTLCREKGSGTEIVRPNTCNYADERTISSPEFAPEERL